MNLNDEQRAAVRRLGQDVCVVAGPGTGKTRVLTERFCWLVREQGVAPGRILAITFTEKAAAEIKNRLAGEFQSDEDTARQVEQAYVSTIDGFCTRLLRENAVAAGVDLGFNVLEESARKGLLRESAEEALDGLFADHPDEVRRLMPAVAVSSRQTEMTADLPGALTDVYEALRVAGDDWRSAARQVHRPPGLTEIVAAIRGYVSGAHEWRTAAQQSRWEHFREWLAEVKALADAAPGPPHLAALAALNTKKPGLPKQLQEDMGRLRNEIIPKVRAGILLSYYAPLRALLFEAIERLDGIYRERKRTVSGLDFADLEEGALGLLNASEDIRSRLQEQFDYILMDELQDTNPLQWEIVNRIRRPDRFFGVGDINQSIYGFRHARPAVFRDYEESLKERGLPVERLVVNYRSRQEILDTVSWALDGQPGIVTPNLRSADQPGAPGSLPVEVMICRGEMREEAARREARWIARRIGQFAAADIPLRDIAVLARKMRSLAPIAEALREEAIPSVTTGGQTLYEARETLDLMQALNVLANTQDDISLAGLLRSPLVGLRDETLMRLKPNHAGLWDGLTAAVKEPPAGIDAADLERIRWVKALLEELRAQAADVSASRLLARFLDESGYLSGLDPQGRANLSHLLRSLRERFHGEGRPLAEVAAELARYRSHAPEAEAPPPDASNSVQLMSIHASKGLEFPVVFIPALDSQVSGKEPPICRSARYGIGVRWVEPETGKKRGDLAYEDVKDAHIAGRVEEEWRLLFVAMTRAERYLILSWVATNAARGSDWTKGLSERLRLPAAGDEDVDEELANPDSAAAIRFLVRNADPEATGRPPVSLESTPPAEVARPEVREQHDSTVAITHLSAFADCPRKYYLRHYLRFDGEAPAQFSEEEESWFDPHEEDVRTHDAAQIGVQVHNLLAGLGVDNPHPEATRLADSARQSTLGQRAARAVRCQREYGFLFEFEGIVLRGQIDAWFEEEGGAVLVDYKTDNFDPDEEPHRVQPYLLQLRLYALALQRLLGRLPKSALLHFIRPDKVVDVSLDEADLEAAREVVRRLIEAQESLAFPTSVGGRCRSCEFRGGLCPAEG